MTPGGSVFSHTRPEFQNFQNLFSSAVSPEFYRISLSMYVVGMIPRNSICRSNRKKSSWSNQSMVLMIVVLCSQLHIFYFECPKKKIHRPIFQVKSVDIAHFFYTFFFPCETWNCHSHISSPRPFTNVKVDARMSHCLC